MTYWIRQFCLVVLGVLLSGLPLEVQPPDPATEASPSATRPAPAADRLPAGTPPQLCVRASVAPLELGVWVRTQNADERVTNKTGARPLTLCVGAASGPDETDRSTPDD
jgi:hypothetical protein